MRVLPCKSGGQKCGGQPALLTKAGEIYTIGQMVDRSIKYVCARCGLPSRLTADEYHLLPEVPDPPPDAR